MGQPTQPEQAAPGALPFGRLVRQYRRVAGLTQEELAERAGLSERGVREIERGAKHMPHKETVHLLADALELEGSEREAFQGAARRVGEAKPFGPMTLPSELRTFLIADIRGYTRFTEEQGDEAAARLASRFAEVVEEVVGRHGGQLLELRGDEAMVIFSSAREAIRAAVQLQHRVAQERAVHPELPLQVGVGLDTGDVVPIKGGYRGGALNLAARLCNLAGAGEVFTTEPFVHLARRTEGCVYIDRGQVHLKGLIDPVRVIQIAPEGAVPSDLPPLEQVLVGPPTNLPDEATSFIGREPEIAALSELLRRPGVRLVTLTGTGGTGKTRLALQVASRLLYSFDDGVFFVPLGSLGDPDLVPSAIAEAVGITQLEGASRIDAVMQYLQTKHVLLVLDNYEHLLDAAPLVAELLDRCRALHLLVTSRIPLHLAREHEYAVPPLSLPDLHQLPALELLSRYDAVALFVERAQAAKASFALTAENAPAVAEVCQQLDGLPLAIELAAARIKLFPPRVLVQRLTSRLTLLTGGARDRPARHQTLRAAIDWSYHLLEEGEQQLFARLSVFAGGCTLEAVEGVCNASGDLEIDVLDGVARLLDKGLLRQEEKEEPRFGMLETVREYALERLEERGERERLREGHALYYLALAESAQPHLTGPEEERWLSRLENEIDNLRAALRWAQERDAVEIGLRLAGALRVFWTERGDPSEGSWWLEAFLARTQQDENAVSVEVRAKALFAAGYVAAGDFPWEWARRDDAAGRLYEQSLALSRELRDEALTAEALIYLAQWAVWWNPGRTAELAQQGLTLARTLGAKDLITYALYALAVAAHLQGDAELARELFRESLALGRTLGSKRELARLLTWQGQAMHRLGDRDRARELSEESLAIRQATGHKRGMTAQFNALAVSALERGDYQEATRLFEEGLALQRERGDDRGVAQQLGLLGWMMEEQGAYERAIALSQEGLELSRRAGDKLGVAIALLHLSDVARNQGDAEQVAVLCEESLALLREVGDVFLTGFALHNLALAARARGDYGRARALLEEILSSAPEYWPGLSEVSASMGLVALDEEDWERAQQAFTESLLLRTRVFFEMSTAAMDMEGLAGVAVGREQLQHAACLLGAAGAIRARIGTPVWPVNRPSYERHLTAARQGLGEERFTAAWEEGRTMTVEQAIDYALNLVPVPLIQD